MQKSLAALSMIAFWWFLAHGTVVQASTSEVDASFAQDWEFLYVKDGIKVYKKDFPGSSIVGFKGEMDLDTSLDRVFTVLSDLNYRRLWVDRLKDVEAIRAYPGGQGFVEYYRMAMPWPISDRDFVISTRITYDPIKKTMQSITNSIEDPTKPVLPGVVRGTTHGTQIVLTPLAPGKTHLSFALHGDPNGYFPSWLINLIQRNWPYNTLSMVRNALFDKNINVIVCKEYYQLVNRPAH
jgi:hypothetical protein